MVKKIFSHHFSHQFPNPLHHFTAKATYNNDEFLVRLGDDGMQRIEEKRFPATLCELRQPAGRH